MADPTIQTFCCHHANDTDMAVRIMEEFNTDAYNAVCLTSSALGMIGALYQVRIKPQIIHDILKITLLIIYIKFYETFNLVVYYFIRYYLENKVL